MKLTPRLIENLKKVLSGERISYSSLPGSLVAPLVNEGLLTVVHHGSHRQLFSANPEALAGTLPRYHEALSDLDTASTIFSGEGCKRSAQAFASGNSKIKAERSCPGFLVNSYTPVECTLQGEIFTVTPVPGSATYISDWRTFVPSSSVLIVGIENMENFLEIRSQKHLFESFLLPGETSILFVARYAFSSDLSEWLSRLPNRYLHFGDFDLAGIHIFLSQFKPHVGDRGSYLIPPDIESRISRGSRQRYDEQYIKYENMAVPDENLLRLVSIIRRYRRCYDQEGYILGR